MKHNPPIEITAFRISPNGDGSSTVSIAYKDDHTAQHNSTCCQHRPAPTKAERLIADEKNKIRRAEQKIAAIRQAGPQAKAVQQSQPGLLQKLLPRRWPEHQPAPRPIGPRQQKFRNILLGLCIGTLTAAFYIIFRTI